MMPTARAVGRFLKRDGELKGISLVLPALLRIASKGLPKDERFANAQQALVATIVHNAGIYNGIFGTATLKSPVPALQAVIGVIGWFLL